MERNDKHNLDRLLREKLDAPQHAQDAELWHSIERELDKRKRRGLFMRNRIVLMLVFLLVGSGNFFTIRESIKTQRVTMHNASATVPQHDASEKNKTSDAASSHAQPQHEPTNSAFTTARAAEPAAQPYNGNNRDDHTAHQAVIPSQTKPTVADRTELAISTNVDVTSNAIEANTSANHVTAIEEHATNQNTVEQSDATTPAELTSNLNGESNEAVTYDDAETIVAETMLNQIADSAQQDLLQELHQVVADTAAVASSVNETDPQAEKIIGNPLKQKRFIWTLALQAQLNQVSKQLTGEGFSPLYMQRRNNEEHNAQSFSYGLRGGLEYKRFVLQTGVGMRAYAEDIYYENRSQRYLLKSVGYVQDSAIYYQYDTTAVNEVNDKLGAYNGRSVNRYLEVPLLIGYRVGTPAISVQPSVGVSFAKPLRWSSRYLNAQANDLVEPQSAYGLAPVVKSFVSELTLALALSNHFYLDASAVYNRNLQSVFSRSTGLNQRYQSIGGGVALRYAF